MQAVEVTSIIAGTCLMLKFYVLCFGEYDDLLSSNIHPAMKNTSKPRFFAHLPRSPSARSRRWISHPDFPGLLPSVSMVPVTLSRFSQKKHGATNPRHPKSSKYLVRIGVWNSQKPNLRRCEWGLIHTDPHQVFGCLGKINRFGFLKNI